MRGMIRSGFLCRRCGERIGDAMYTGPAGHAPAEVCFTCWVNAFEDRPKNWPRQVLALWLVANGYTQTQAARRVGASGRTVRQWRMKLAKDPEAFWALMARVDELDIRRLPPRCNALKEAS